MQKKLIALAIAGLAAAPAFAQSNVTIYGRMDLGLVNTSGNSGGVTNAQSRNAIESGVQGGSRIGFRGTEDLGGGLKAIFEVESGVNLDRDNAATGATGGVFSANRHSWVGLTGGFGTVVAGRLDGVRYGIYNKYDPFAGGTVGNFTQMTAQVDRADNAIAYISPSFSGFKVTAAYATHIGPDALYTNGTTNEAAGNVGDAQLMTLALSYDNGPISAVVDVENVKEKKDPAGNGKHEVRTIAGSYDFGMVKLSGLWDSHKANTSGAPGTSNNVNYRAYFIGLSAPVAGAGLVKFVWGKTDDKNPGNADADKWGLGFDYALSKRTNLYVDYGKIKNKNGATYRITPAANVWGAAIGSTTGVKGFDLGIAHKF